MYIHTTIVALLLICSMQSNIQAKGNSVGIMEIVIPAVVSAIVIKGNEWFKNKNVCKKPEPDPKIVQFKIESTEQLDSAKQLLDDRRKKIVVLDAEMDSVKERLEANKTAQMIDDCKRYPDLSNIYLQRFDEASQKIAMAANIKNAVNKEVDILEQLVKTALPKYGIPYGVIN